MNYKVVLQLKVIYGENKHGDENRGQNCHSKWGFCDYLPQSNRDQGRSSQTNHGEEHDRCPWHHDEYLNDVGRKNYPVWVPKSARALESLGQRVGLQSAQSMSCGEAYVHEQVQYVEKLLGGLDLPSPGPNELHQYREHTTETRKCCSGAVGRKAEKTAVQVKEEWGLHLQYIHAKGCDRHDEH